MPRSSDKEIDESYDREGLVLDDQDLDLLRHIFEDNEDSLPQGLHQGKRKDLTGA